MTEALVKPENLADLVRGDASAAFPSQTCTIRSDIRNDAIKPLRILKVKGHSKEFADVHIEHIALRINDALMEKDALQIDPWTSWDLERNFETFEAEDGHADESVRGAVKNSDLANDGSEVGIVR
jgi:hypothetical protein